MKQALSFTLPVLLAISFSCTEKWISLMPDANYSNWSIQAIGPNSGSSEEIVLTGSRIMLYGAEDVPTPRFRNFVLSAKVFTEPGTVASLWFHRSAAAGYEIVLGDGHIDNGRLEKGSLADVRNIYEDMAPGGGWYDLEVAVRGKNITVKIDDILLVDYVEPAEPYRLLPDRCRLGAGTFALDCHEGTTRIREMKVLRLADDAAGRTDAVDETTDRVIRLQQAGFPVIDHHVHLKGWSQDQAMDNSRRTGIFYAIAPNCGIGFPITNDAEVANFIDTTRNVPAMMAMQGEGREWPTTFSAASREKFDFVFTDALTFTDHAGRRVRLWIDEEVIIDVPEQQYMDRIVDATVGVISGEPIDVFVNPFFLPTAMMDDYDALWTDTRIARVIDALVKHGVALEVNARYRIPNARTIRAAMAAGVPLTFGTNNGDADIGRLEYCFEMMDECGITAEHMYWPEQH